MNRIKDETMKILFKLQMTFIALQKKYINLVL